MPILFLLLLPLIVGAVSLRIVVRPEIFSICAGCCLSFTVSECTEKFATKELLAICLLLLFWTSYHSPIIGFIIIFGLFLEKAINKVIHKDDSFSWLQWFFWGVLVFSTGFFNLNFNGHSIIGPHFVIGMINTVFQMVSDNISRSIVMPIHLTRQMFLLISRGCYQFTWRAWSIIKRQYGFAFIVVLLTVLSWSMVRLLSIVLLINMSVLALYLTQFINSAHFHNLRVPVKNMMILASVLVSLLAFYYLFDKAQLSIEQRENRTAHMEQRYPVQVADYLEHIKDGGNILNVMQDGAYLIYKLSPDYKIYFDGRTNILYPVEFVKHNGELWRKEMMRQLLRSTILIM